MKESQSREIFLPCKRLLMLISPTALYRIIFQVINLKGESRGKFHSSFTCHKLFGMFIDLVEETTIFPLECDLSLLKVEGSMAMKMSQFPIFFQQWLFTAFLIIAHKLCSLFKAKQSRRPH